MSDKPIPLHAHEVRGVRDGRQTQLRRVLRQQPVYVQADYLPGHGWAAKEKKTAASYFWPPHSVQRRFLTEIIKDPAFPYQPGDRLWVRETWCPSPDGPIYRATEQEHGMHQPGDANVWRPSVHMPRWASRLTLLVTDVRVQRVQEISDVDACAEGVRSYGNGSLWQVDHEMRPRVASATGPVECFGLVWDSINAKRGYGWDSNPWIVAVTFTAHQQNIDSLEQAA